MRRFTTSTIIASLTASCGGAPERTSDEPEASSEEALSRAADVIDSGERVCSGTLSYSLACYAVARSAACGVDTSPATCTTYAACAHPDFGVTRGTYSEVVSPSARTPTRAAIDAPRSTSPRSLRQIARASRTRTGSAPRGPRRRSSAPPRRPGPRRSRPGSRSRRVVSPTRTTRFPRPGQGLRAEPSSPPVLRRIEQQPAPFAGLATHHNARWADLKQRIVLAEQAFEPNPAEVLFGVDLWSGPDQRPSQHYLSASRDFPRCGGGTFAPGVDRLPFSFGRWTHDELLPFMVAGNRGLGTLDACIEGHWSWHSYIQHPWGTTWTFRLDAEVHVRYDRVKIYTHRFNGTTERTHTFYTNYPEPTFNPDTYWSPYPVLNDNWGSLTSPDSIRTFSGQSARTAVRSAVSADLKALQEEFYTGVAARLTQAGDGLSVAANRLSGSKQLWESYVAMGLPLSLENNEALREQLHGSEAVLTGRDVGSDDALINDIEDACRFVAAAPPDTNVLTDIDGSVVSRSNRLNAGRARPGAAGRHAARGSGRRRGDRRWPFARAAPVFRGGAVAVRLSPRRQARGRRPRVTAPSRRTSGTPRSSPVAAS